MWVWGWLGKSSNLCGIVDDSGLGEAQGAGASWDNRSVTMPTAQAPPTKGCGACREQGCIHAGGSSTEGWRWHGRLERSDMGTADCSLEWSSPARSHPSSTLYFGIVSLCTLINRTWFTSIFGMACGAPLKNEVKSLIKEYLLAQPQRQRRLSREAVCTYVRKNLAALGLNPSLNRFPNWTCGFICCVFYFPCFFC